MPINSYKTRARAERLSGQHLVSVYLWNWRTALSKTSKSTLEKGMKDLILKSCAYIFSFQSGLLKFQLL